MSNAIEEDNAALVQDTTTKAYEDNISTLNLMREEQYLQSLRTTQQFEDTSTTLGDTTTMEDTTTIGDTTFGEKLVKLPTTTFTTRGVASSSTTSEEPVFQHIGYKVLRTTTPTEMTGNPDVDQHITYRDGYKLTLDLVLN